MKTKCTNVASSTTLLIYYLKSSYYTSIIQAHSNDQKVPFETVNKLLKKKKSRFYTSAPSSDVLANRFADVFHEKISTIRQDLQPRLPSVDQTPHPDETCFAELCIFDAVIHEEVKAFANKSIFMQPCPNGCMNISMDALTHFFLL